MFDAVRRFSLLLAVPLLASACTVIRPPGWPASDQEPTVIQATSGRMYVTAPTSWDLPSGETILVAVDRASVTSGFGLYHAQIAFTASLDREQIRCESEPAGPSVPQTRFGCWSIGSGADKLEFWLAPGEDCPARHMPYITTLTTPSCWNGELTMNGQRASLQHGYVESTGVPVGYVSWMSSANELLLAADIVTEAQVHIYEPKRALPDQVKRRLILLTVALSWWEHASQPS